MTLLTSEAILNSRLVEMVTRQSQMTNAHRLRRVLLHCSRFLFYPFALVLSFACIAMHYLLLGVTACVAGLADLLAWCAAVFSLGHEFGGNPIKAMSSDASNARWHLRGVFRKSWMRQYLADVLHAERIPESAWPESLRGIPQSPESLRECVEAEAERLAESNAMWQGVAEKLNTK